MSARNVWNLVLVGLCLLGTLMLGLAVWAVADADEEPTPTTLAVADLESAEDEPGRGRVEIVETGDRVWLKLQVREIPYEDATLVLTGAGQEPLEIPVEGDGDYSLAGGDPPPTDGEVWLRSGETVVLSGTMVVAD